MSFSPFTLFSISSHHSTRFFVRWMRGTCIICPSTRGGDGERVVNINFSQELERCPQIYEPETVFNERVVKLNRIVIDFLRRLVLYTMLWHQDKVGRAIGCNLI